MKKMVGESLNEKFKENSDPIDDLGIGLRKYLVKIKKHCEQTIKSCEKVLKEYEEQGIEFGGGNDYEDDYSIANNEGRIEVCQNILDIIEKFYK